MFIIDPLAAIIIMVVIAFAFTYFIKRELN